MWATGLTHKLCVLLLCFIFNSIPINKCQTEEGKKIDTTKSGNRMEQIKNETLCKKKTIISLQLNELWTGSICEVYKNHSRNESSSYHLKKKESAATHLNQVEMVFVSCTGQRREKNHLCIINRHFVRQQRTSLSFWFTRTTKKRQLIPLNAWCGDLFFFCCCFCFAFFLSGSVFDFDFLRCCW